MIVDNVLLSNVLLAVMFLLHQCDVEGMSCYLLLLGICRGGKGVYFLW